MSTNSYNINKIFGTGTGTQYDNIYNMLRDEKLVMINEMIKYNIQLFFCFSFFFILYFSHFLLLIGRLKDSGFGKDT